RPVQPESRRHPRGLRPTAPRRDRLRPTRLAASSGGPCGPNPAAVDSTRRHSASAAPSPRSWLVPDRRKKSRARQLSEMVSETCWSARDLPIRGRYRQARVAADDVPVAFESLNQLHVLARFQRTEASDPPVRVSPKTQVCAMNMVVMRPVGSIATYM